MPWTNDPSGTGLSAVPASGGTGWNIWTSSEEGGSGGDYSTGVPYYDKNNNIYPFLSSSDTTCFKMYAPNPADISAVRELLYPLSIGNGVDTGLLSVNLGINYRNGEKGIIFLKDNTAVTGFRAIQGVSDQYQWYDGEFSTWNDIVIPFYNDSVFNIRVFRINTIGIGNYNAVEIYRLNYEGVSSPIVGPEALFTGSNSAINKIIIYTKFTDSNVNDVNENTLYFNFLSGHSAYR